MAPSSVYSKTISRFDVIMKKNEKNIVLDDVLNEIHTPVWCAKAPCSLRGREKNRNLCSGGIFVCSVQTSETIKSLDLNKKNSIECYKMYCSLQCFKVLSDWRLRMKKTYITLGSVCLQWN